MYLSFTTVPGFCYQLRFSIFIEMLVCYFRLLETREKYHLLVLPYSDFKTNVAFLLIVTLSLQEEES